MQKLGCFTIFGNGAHFVNTVRNNWCRLYYWRLHCGCHHYLPDFRFTGTADSRRTDWLPLSGFRSIIPLIVEFTDVAASDWELQTAKSERIESFARGSEQCWRSNEASLLFRQRKSIHMKDQPLQFIVCGILQCFIDGFVIVQILYYRSKNPKVEEDKVPSSEKKQ